MIAILDYKMGNLSSIQNMLSKVGYKSEITDNLNHLSNFKKIILPGVGNFDFAVKNLKDLKLFNYIQDFSKIKDNKILGICLGMQLLGYKSEEGVEEGLGLIQGVTKKFSLDNLDLSYKVPHMGWNSIKVTKPDKILKGIDDSFEFYFAHSYYFEAKNNEDVLFKTNHGFEFCSGVSNENIYGFQFHPEKSHRYGFKIFKNFGSL